mgnify:CR=1 FL=1
MATRSAETRWTGSLKEGEGTMKLESGAFDGKFSFSTRFEDGVGTNPEEMIAAAEAGCYTMALNNELYKAGHEPNYVHTRATVRMGRIDDQPSITKMILDVEADVPDMDEDTFTEFAETTKEACLISRALNIPEWELNITFKS